MIRFNKNVRQDRDCGLLFHHPLRQSELPDQIGLANGEFHGECTSAPFSAFNSHYCYGELNVKQYKIDKDDLFAAAKSEKDESLRREAIRQLGVVRGISELQQLYQKESSTEVKREILQAFFVAGDSGRLVEAANGEKDPELRRTAIRNLGLINSADSAQALKTIYAKETDRSLREEVLNAYFLQGNAAALVAIARSEKDPGLKKTAVSKLALMHNKEATEYLMEILQK
jgi:HEAT repeat protein